MKTIILLLLPITLAAQKLDWLKPTKNQQQIFLLQFVSGFADGTNQAIVHHRLGEGTDFWDIRYSWKNKYEDFDKGDTRAAYPGSKTWLVFTTDGFHLTRFVGRSADVATICISIGDSWKEVKQKFIAATLGRSAGWVLSYYVVWREK